MTEEQEKQQQFLQLMEDQKNKQISTEVAEEKAKKESFDEEYNFAKDQMVELAEMGKKALEQLEEVVSETNEPRAYRVFAELLNANKDIINSIMDNAKKKSDMSKVPEQKKMVGEQEQPLITNNNTTVFVGTTKDLLTRIAEEEKKQIIIDAEAQEVK